MNVLEKPDVYEKPLGQWFDRKIINLLDNTPTQGEVKVKWYQEAFDEADGEFVTVERWNGYAWEQHGLDVHMTVQDLLDLNERIGGRNG